MTYIEFYDKTASENICACLVNVPDRVILIGDNSKRLDRHCKYYHSFFLRKGYDVEFTHRSINKNDMQHVIDELTDIVETYDDCVFDLTGGEDIYLVAMGIVFERNRDKNIQMHRFNLLNGCIIDCDMDGKTIASRCDLFMNVDENIQIYGGDIVYDTQKEDGTHIWDMSEEFVGDIKLMWEVFKQAESPKHWNTQMEVFAAAERVGDISEDGLTFTVQMSSLHEELSHNKHRFVCRKDIIHLLKEVGIIEEYWHNDDELGVTFKNEQIKRCLTKAGQLLELYVYLLASESEDKNGDFTYNDIMTGVCIDWDGVIGGEELLDTENEIDVIMMHGIVPVFVSCKNGYVSIEELYKLNTVAERFGGRYAKKVLVTTDLRFPTEQDEFSRQYDGDVDTRAEHDEFLRQRARDMNIHIVKNIQNMSDKELKKLIRNLWQN